MSEAIDSPKGVATNARKKLCTQCKESKPLLAFFRDKSRKDGYAHRCKECSKTNYAAWYQDNKERVSKRQADWHLANRERSLARSAAWRNSHREHIQARDAAYYKAHQQQKRESSRARSKQGAEQLSDTYVRQVLTDGTSLRYRDVPQSLVDAKREHLRVIRALSIKDTSNE